MKVYMFFSLVLGCGLSWTIQPSFAQNIPDYAKKHAKPILEEGLSLRKAVGPLQKCLSSKCDKAASLSAKIKAKKALSQLESRYPLLVEKSIKARRDDPIVLDHRGFVANESPLKSLDGLATHGMGRLTFEDVYMELDEIDLEPLLKEFRIGEWVAKSQDLVARYLLRRVVTEFVFQGKILKPSDVDYLLSHTKFTRFFGSLEQSATRVVQVLASAQLNRMAPAHQNRLTLQLIDKSALFAETQELANKVSAAAKKGDSEASLKSNIDELRMRAQFVAKSWARPSNKAQMILEDLAHTGLKGHPQLVMPELIQRAHRQYNLAGDPQALKPLVKAIQSDASLANNEVLDKAMSEDPDFGKALHKALGIPWP